MSLFTTQGYRYQLVAGDNVILDTFQDESIKVSNNITQLFDIAAVPGTFTRTITLPGTKKNNEFFELYYDISVYSPDTFNANQKVAAYLDFGSAFLVNGYLQLTKVNVYENKFVDSYEVNLFGAISNFSVETNRLYLTDLDNLSTYNHTSSYDSITGSWAGELFNGDIVYPMADYGKRLQFSTQDFIGIDDNEDALTVSDYKPALRLKAIWDGIFDKVGFTYTGSFFNEPFLDDVYVTLNNKARYPEYTFANLETFGQGKVSAITGSADNYALTNNTITNFPLAAVNYDYNGLFTVGNPIRYTTPISSSRYSANIQLSYRVTSNGANTQSQYPAWYLYYYDDNGNQLNVQTLATINDYTERVALGKTETQTENFTINQFVNIPRINSGSVNFKILYQAYTTAGGGGIAATPNFNVVLNPTAGRDFCSLEISQVRQAADFRVLDIPSNMPFGTNGIKLVEFIRSVQKKFNLIIYESKSVPNQMIVETFNDWYLQGTVQNFNQYINLDDKIEFIPASTLAVNKINFTDKDDTDYVEKVFKQTNNRVYGQAFWLDTGSYFSEGEFKVETNFASGPIFQLPLTVASGSAVTTLNCRSYNITNESEFTDTIEYTECTAGTQEIIGIPGGSTTTICSRDIPFSNSGISTITEIGDCSPTPTPLEASSSFLPVAIPLYIGDQNYAPTQVFPRMMFFNGMVSSSQYWIEGQFSAANREVIANAETVYPYFDNYNVVTGSFPTTGSRSLLFNNEQATLGTIPQNSLIDEYWRTYLELLYDPRTRLVNAAAVIPFAAYFNIELNDLVQFRGNYYHLRAINDYDLSTGECMVQLLGPVIGDTVSVQLFGTPKKKTIIEFGDFNCDFNKDFTNPSFGNSTIICTNCCAPTVDSAGISGSSLLVTFTLGTGSTCIPCQSVSFVSSSDGFVTPPSAPTVQSCTSPASMSYTPGFEYAMYTNCIAGFNSNFVGPFGVNLLNVDYLVVAGGGGGGGAGGGGGGAGGLISGSTTLQSGYYPIFVGQGGEGGPIVNASGTLGPLIVYSGSRSYFDTFIATGGGGGGAGRGPETGFRAGDGGSGGGTAMNPLTQDPGGSGSLGQGFNGGLGTGYGIGGAGGGGGAGGPGGFANGVPTGINSWAGTGGVGAMWLDGLRYAGGGSAGYTTDENSPDSRFYRSAPAYDGGGFGRWSQSGSGIQAVEGTGGGGFGGAFDANTNPYWLTAGFGASGIVKIRYPGSGSQATGGDIYYSGSYTYHKFTCASGSKNTDNANGSGTSYTFQVF
jgi:hypothetical protein